MSEEQKKETSAPVEVKEQPKEEIKAEQKLFTQEQLDNIIQNRIIYVNCFNFRLPIS